MLKIDKSIDGCVTRLRLSGRIQSDEIACILSVMNDGCGRKKILNLTEVTLVDLGVIHFLISCERQGVELIGCPPYISEWILRERAQGS